MLVHDHIKYFLNTTKDDGLVQTVDVAFPEPLADTKPIEDDEPRKKRKQAMTTKPEFPKLTATVKGAG